LVLITKKKINFSWNQLGKIALLAVLLQAAPFVGIFWGQQHVAPALAGILIAAVPLFTVLFSFLLGFERSGIGTKAVGILIGFLGIVVIFSPEIQKEELAATWGIGTILFGASCYAMGGIFLRKFNGSIDRWTNLIVQGVIASTLLWIISFATEPTSALLNISATGDIILATLYLGVFSSGLAFVAFFFVVDALGPIRASTLTYPMAVVAILTDVIYFGKAPDASMIMGTLLIFSGVFVVQFAPTLLIKWKGRNKKAYSEARKGSLVTR